MKTGISAIGETLYLAASGVLSERLIGSGDVVQWTNYLSAGGEMVGMRVEHSTSGTYTRYFHKDHLGSVLSSPMRRAPWSSGCPTMPGASGASPTARTIHQEHCQPDIYRHVGPFLTVFQSLDD